MSHRTLSTIIINGNTKIGNYCCLSNNIIIADGHPKKIGNDVFLGSNVVLAKSVIIADGCKISSNSFVNRNALINNVLLGGVVAQEIKSIIAWTEEEPYKTEKARCENLKIALKIID